MAKFSSTTFGQISGRHGTAVAAQYNGKSILKVYTAPSNPRTVKQKTHRLKFAIVTQGINPLRSVINDGFSDSQGYNWSMSSTMTNAVSGTYPNLLLDYSKVVIAGGPLPRCEVAHVVKKSVTTVSADWDSTLFDGAAATDKVTFVFFNVASRNRYVAKDVAVRSAAKCDIALPAVWTGATVHCWMYFSSALTVGNSSSLYLAKLTL